MSRYLSIFGWNSTKRTVSELGLFPSSLKKEKRQMRVRGKSGIVSVSSKLNANFDRPNRKHRLRQSLSTQMLTLTPLISSTMSLRHPHHTNRLYNRLLSSPNVVDIGLILGSLYLRSPQDPGFTNH